jgi:hypothetical protein
MGLVAKVSVTSVALRRRPGQQSSGPFLFAVLPHVEAGLMEKGAAMRGMKVAAAIVAIVGWVGLALQYALITNNVGLGLGTWRFIGFFTILSNIGIAGVATAIALGRGGWLTLPRARLMGLTAIVTVGFVYSLLLRSTWNPQGWQKVADAVLHDATPLLFLGLWVLAPHGELKWSDLKWALAFPAAYLAYTLIRGAFDGWYPYYFLNPALQTPVELTLSILGVVAVFAIIAGCAIALDMRLGRRRAEFDALTF